jgi:hypothetical protein
MRCAFYDVTKLLQEDTMRRILVGSCTAIAIMAGALGAASAGQFSAPAHEDSGAIVRIGGDNDNEYSHKYLWGRYQDNGYRYRHRERQRYYRERRGYYYEPAPRYYYAPPPAYYYYPEPEPSFSFGLTLPLH